MVQTGIFLVMSEEHWPPRRGDTVWDGEHCRPGCNHAAYGMIYEIDYEDLEILVFFKPNRWNPEPAYEEYSFDVIEGYWRETGEYGGYWELNKESAVFADMTKRR